MADYIFLSTNSAEKTEIMQGVFAYTNTPLSKIGFFWYVNPINYARQINGVVMSTATNHAYFSGSSTFSVSVNTAYNTKFISSNAGYGGASPLSGVTVFNDKNSMLSAMDDGIWEILPDTYPITYRLTNCTAPTAPTEAAVGDIVNVSFTFPDGYGFSNPATDVYVYNNGVLVPSSYANNILTFTMPDPL